MYQLNPSFREMGSVPNSPKNKLDYCPEDDHLNRDWQWYDPNENSVPVSFCMDSSLHGLQYLGQQKRHIFERLFWLATFLASVVTAIILICGMWSDYRNMPIVTIFNPTETTLDQIPFPGVTICNVNGVQKTPVEKHFAKILGNGILDKVGKLFGKTSSNETFKDLARAADISHICDSVSSFTDRFVQNSTVINIFRRIGRAVRRHLIDVVPYIDPMETLRKVAQPCRKMILHCIWLGEVRSCDKLFQEIETDFGYCCTFNTVPISLLINNYTESQENPEVIQKWKDANLNYENLISSKEDRNYPHRQKYPGRSAGLTFLVDPELHEYYCTHTDSEGFILEINAPLDFPKIKDSGIAIQTNSEIFVGLKPEITLSHGSIKYFPVEKRQCYYDNELLLPHYTKYTLSNCMSECMARRTMEKCNCKRYYMPRDDSEMVCKPQLYNCTDEVRKNITKFGMRKGCQECLPTCTEIDYHKEVTFLPLQDEKIKELFKIHPPAEDTRFFLKRRNSRKVSIVHIYFNVDSVIPKLRKELTTVTKLLSNTGGLLGLFLGFSINSLLEILYYGTLRLCCSFYRKKTIREKNEKLKGDQSNRQYYGSPSANASLHPAQGWFSRMLNGVSEISNIDKKNQSKIQKEEDMEFVKRGTHTENLPLYYYRTGTFKDKF